MSSANTTNTTGLMEGSTGGLNNKKKSELSDSSSSSSSSESESDVTEKNPNAPMGFSIKRKKHHDLIHKSRLLKPNSNFIMICGSTGSGKSTLILYILPCFSNHLKHVIICTAKPEDDSHISIKKYCESNKINFYNDAHDADTANNTIADVLDKKKKNEHLLVIFDDFNINFNSKSEDELNKIMIKVFALLRSQNCSGMVISQTYYNIPTRVRENVTMRLIFQLSNVMSHRAFIDDITGMFFNGSNENTVRNDIKKIYNKVYQEPYKIMVVLSTPTPQIRIGFNEVVYPPDQAGVIIGGGGEQSSITNEHKNAGILKKKINSEIIKKRELYNTAVDLGLPKYYFKNITVKQLQHFISKKSGEGQQKNGNNAEEIEQIINGAGTEDDVHKILREKNRLSRYIREYRRKGNPNNLIYISEICNKLISLGMPSAHIRYILKHTYMDEHIDF